MILARANTQKSETIDCLSAEERSAVVGFKSVSSQKAGSNPQPSCPPSHLKFGWAGNKLWSTILWGTAVRQWEAWRARGQAGESTGKVANTCNLIGKDSGQQNHRETLYLGRRGEMRQDIENDWDDKSRHSSQRVIAWYCVSQDPFVYDQADFAAAFLQETDLF